MNRYSGKFVLRVSPKLHETLAKKAESEKTSLNQIANRLIQESLQSEKSEPPYIKQTKKLLPKIIAQFEDHLLGVALFGSTVRGEATQSSDIDLLIVLKKDQPIKRSLYHRWESLSQPAGPVINPHFVHLPVSEEAASGIWFEVALESKLIYQKGEQIENFLEKLKQLIHSGELQRDWSHGHPYWIRRDNAK